LLSKLLASEDLLLAGDDLLLKVLNLVGLALDFLLKAVD